MKPSWGALFAAILAFAGCTQTPPPPPPGPAPHPHFTLGDPYQADGHWYYPAEDYAFDQTGIATIAAPKTGLTADGEAADPALLTAAMQTLQLPCIATVTNLENGRQITLRVNDRGPADPARLIALSPRAAQLLAITGPARVRVQLDTAASHTVAETTAGAPRLAIATAAPSSVTAEALPPPGAHGGGGQLTDVALGAAPQASQAVPLHMPERILQLPPAPGALYLRAGSFGRFNYANVLAAKLYGLGGTVLRSREGRQEVYEVRAGPFGTIAQADAALRTALARGLTDARISIE